MVHFLLCFPTDSVLCFVFSSVVEKVYGKEQRDINQEVLYRIVCFHFCAHAA